MLPVLRSERGDWSHGRSGAVETAWRRTRRLTERPTNQTRIHIRALFDRLDRAEHDADWPLVLHTSASIFETLAKLVVPYTSIQDQTLASFFGASRKHAALAAPLLDVIEDIYRRRNVEPLSGHGSAQKSSITREEAILCRAIDANAGDPLASATSTCATYFGRRPFLGKALRAQYALGGYDTAKTRYVPFASGLRVNVAFPIGVPASPCLRERRAYAVTPGGMRARQCDLECLRSVIVRLLRTIRLEASKLAALDMQRGTTRRVGQSRLL